MRTYRRNKYGVCFCGEICHKDVPPMSMDENEGIDKHRETTTII